MPQIAQISEIFASQLFWLALTFGIIFFGIGLGMLPKIQSTVDLRDQRIAKDIERAERSREDADRLEQEYRAALDKARADANAAVARAKADSAIEAEQKMAELDRKLDAQLAAEQQRIAAARTAASAELESIAAEATREIIERLTPLSISTEDARETVARELARG